MYPYRMLLHLITWIGTVISPKSLVSDLGIKEVSDIFRDEPYLWDESLRKKSCLKSNSAVARSICIMMTSFFNKGCFFSAEGCCAKNNLVFLCC